VRRIVLVSAACAASAAVLAAGSHETVGPGGGRHLIVYWSTNPWPSIWSIRTSGKHRRRILRNHQNAKRPRLSPDRQWVAFDGAPPGKPPLRDFDIQLVRPDGTGRKTLTDSSEWDDIDAEWSPDGQLIAFERRPRPAVDDRDSVIWTIRRDGTDARPLVRGFSARWSPDGSRIVYETPEQDLALLDLATGKTEVLLRTPELEQPADWSPEGTRILFIRYGERSSRIFVMNADGTGIRKLATGTAASWSPKGVRILYTRRFPASDLYVMDADGTHKHRLALASAADPDWR
jgi:Tol biopolymer transport system component